MEYQCKFISFLCYILSPFPIISFAFFASNCLRVLLFTDLLEGVLSYNPPGSKIAFLAFGHFLIEPPLHCNIELGPMSGGQTEDYSHGGNVTAEGARTKARERRKAK